MLRAIAICSVLLACLIPLRAGEIPFRYNDGLIWIDVSVPSRGTQLTFLLDTGATASVLDLETAKKLGVRRGRPVRVSGVESEANGYWPSKLEARAGDISLPKKFLVVSLNELSRSCRCPIDGLIGADFFKDKVVSIDFAHGVIRACDKRPATDSDTQDALVPLKLGAKGAILAPITVDRQTGWVRLDTGFAGAVDWVRGEVKSERTRVSVGLSEVITPMTVADVHLGGMVFEDLPTGIHDRPIFAGEAGLLGNGLLENFLIVIDLPGRKLRLKKM